MFLRRSWPPMSGSIRARTSTGSPSPIVKPMRAVRRRQDRRLPGFAARAAGTARPPDRPCDRQQRGGPPLVAVFLLHAGGQPGIRPEISGRDQARGARHPEGGRSVRDRAGAGRAAPRRWRLHRRATIMRCRHCSEHALRQMAGVRRRGHDPLLRAAPARSGLDQVEPAEDHRRRHRLALPRTSSNAS